MKPRFYFAVILVAFAFTALPAADLEIEPDSDYWKELYDPPYKKPTEVPIGTELRKELFNLVRPKLEAIAKQPIKFQGNMKAYRNWALFTGQSLDKDGKPVAYPDLGNSDTVALWLRTVDGWKLVDFSGGHSDVFYLIWTEQYGVPRALIYREAE